MKQSYTKPTLYAETFQLVEHVAGECGANIQGHNFNSITSCGITDSTGTSFFQSGVTNCGSELMVDSEDELKFILQNLHISCYNSAMDAVSNGGVMIGS